MKAKREHRELQMEEAKELLSKAFGSANNSLQSNSRINLRMSGTTCVSVLIVGRMLLCANVGDSRAVLIRSFED